MTPSVSWNGLVKRVQTYCGLEIVIIAIKPSTSCIQRVEAVEPRASAKAVVNFPSPPRTNAAGPTGFASAAARNSHLNFAPGSRFLYSNTNFLLLGIIIERLTRKKLGDVLAERIFKPLGMTDTMLAAEIDTVIPYLATGYLGDDKQGFRRAAHAYPQGGEGGHPGAMAAEDLG